MRGGHRLQKAAEQNCMELLQLASQHKGVFFAYFGFFIAHYAACLPLIFPRLCFHKQLDFRAVCGICQALFDYFSNKIQAPWKSSTLNSFPAAEALLCIGNFGLQGVKGENQLGLNHPSPFFNSIKDSGLSWRKRGVPAMALGAFKGIWDSVQVI